MSAIAAQGYGSAGPSGLSYEDFLKSKKKQAADVGFTADASGYGLFDFQRHVVEWAVRKGRCAIFAGTGLGKTRMQVAFADIIGKETLILCPVAVAAQTIGEAHDMGVTIRRDDRSRITVTNYEQLHNIDWAPECVILDESSILKSHDGKTRNMIQERFARTPYKLCLTATPAPNDYMELGTTAEFLGVSTRLEMLSEFFMHDGGDTSKWRLKRHARSEFWKWVASWAMAFDGPADLGYDGSAYELPELLVHMHEVGTPDQIGGLFGGDPNVSATNLHRSWKGTISERVSMAASITSSGGPCVVWCTSNEEHDALVAALPGCASVKGSDNMRQKEESLRRFATGSANVIVTKPSICGFGLNWQHCSRMVFASFDFSFERTYQAIRRCYRFGQKNPVHVHMIHDASTSSVLSSINAKQMAFDSMHREMSKYIQVKQCTN